MNDLERSNEPAADRIEESVRHALRLVGPGERGVERVWSDRPSDEDAA